LSYIDYLGTLYRSGHRAFLEKVFGNIDSNYKTYGRLFWEIANQVSLGILVKKLHVFN
jgi:hypothetical protein